MKCDCQIPEGGFCERHGFLKNARLVEMCQTNKAYWKLWESGQGALQNPTPALEQQSKKKVGRPGTELKKIIMRMQRMLPWFDLSPRKGCGCEATVRWMDRLGPDKCEKKLPKIIKRLEREAKKRKLSAPFQSFFAERMVRKAIKRARRTK